jgi:hypothetical protein
MMMDLQYINEQFEYEMHRDVPSTVGGEMTINQSSINDLYGIIKDCKEIHQELNSGRINCEDKVIKCKCGKVTVVKGCGLRKYDDPVEYPFASRLKSLYTNALRLVVDMDAALAQRKGGS